jgi:hypothetical protein
MIAPIQKISVLVDDKKMQFEGRVAWTLAQLIAAGTKGCTPIEQPAPRWSDYVFKLRRQGVSVETITEKHTGPYAGHHARYVLRTPLTVLDMQPSEGMAA